MRSDDKSTWSLDDFLDDAGFALEIEVRTAIQLAVAEWLLTYSGCSTGVDELAAQLQDWCDGR